MESLVAMRKEKMTVEELSDILGASSEQIENFENADSDPTLEFVALYAIAVGADIKVTVSSRS